MYSTRNKSSSYGHPTGILQTLDGEGLRTVSVKRQKVKDWNMTRSLTNFVLIVNYARFVQNIIEKVTCCDCCKQTGVNIDFWLT